MKKYRVMDEANGSFLDFSEAKEALDYAETTNGTRRALLIRAEQDGETAVEMKYEITDEEREFDLGGSSLRKARRIKALRDFGAVKAGDLGGFVETEDNLSHEGQCWLFQDAAALGKARVTQNAKLCQKARVFGKAEISGEAFLTDTSFVSGEAKVEGSSLVEGSSAIEDRATVTGTAQLSGTSVGGKAILRNGFFNSPCRITHTEDAAAFDIAVPGLTKITAYRGYLCGRVVQVGRKVIGDPDDFRKYVCDKYSHDSPFREKMEALAGYIKLM